MIRHPESIVQKSQIRNQHSEISFDTDNLLQRLADRQFTLAAINRYDNDIRFHFDDLNERTVNRELFAIAENLRRSAATTEPRFAALAGTCRDRGQLHLM